MNTARAGTLPDTRFALADFARHYEGYAAHFPRYLTAVISRLERAEHRKALLHNLVEEGGTYRDVPALARDVPALARDAYPATRDTSAAASDSTAA